MTKANGMAAVGCTIPYGNFTSCQVTNCFDVCSAAISSFACSLHFCLALFISFGFVTPRMVTVIIPVFVTATYT